MLVIYFYNWKGTMKAMQEFEKEWKGKLDKIKGIKFIGQYTPTNAWNRAWLVETDSVDNLLANSGTKNENEINSELIFLL
jgi:hypothetical protein